MSASVACPNPATTPGTNGLLSGYTTMPIQIFSWTSRPQEAFHELAAATSILLLVLLVVIILLKPEGLMGRKEERRV